METFSPNWIHTGIKKNRFSEPYKGFVVYFQIAQWRCCDFVFLFFCCIKPFQHLSLHAQAFSSNNKDEEWHKYLCIMAPCHSTGPGCWAQTHTGWRWLRGARTPGYTQTAQRRRVQIRFRSAFRSEARGPNCTGTRWSSVQLEKKTTLKLQLWKQSFKQRLAGPSTKGAALSHESALARLHVHFKHHWTIFKWNYVILPIEVSSHIALCFSHMFTGM